MPSAECPARAYLVWVCRCGDPPRSVGVPETDPPRSVGVFGAAKKPRAGLSTGSWLVSLGRVVVGVGPFGPTPTVEKAWILHDTRVPAWSCGKPSDFEKLAGGLSPARRERIVGAFLTTRAREPKRPAGAFTRAAIREQTTLAIPFAHSKVLGVSGRFDCGLWGPGRVRPTIPLISARTRTGSKHHNAVRR